MQPIKDFITRLEITMKCEKMFHNPWMDSDLEMNHYKCTLNTGKKQLMTYFSMGLGISGDPKIEDVLDCLAMDASGYENAQDFEDWCSEYGSDTDSRKAKKTYNIITEQAKKLEEFLGEEEYKKLLWETERE